MSSSPLLVVAGEASGDALAAPVVAELGVRAFGVGGSELAAAGAELVDSLSGAASMGIRGAFSTAPALVRMLPRLVRAVRARRPSAALLVGFSEVNARLAPWLRGQGIRVLWFAPPQVWAWRPTRARGIARAVDRLAVLLPFEAAIWREAGANVEYVGHPAAERTSRSVPRPVADRPALVALLPGSRKHEVRAHLVPLLQSISAVPAERSGIRLRGRLILSGALPAKGADWVRRLSAAHGVPVHEGGIEDGIAGADVAVVASGTATLECAALEVPPIIVYRTDPVTYVIAKRMLRVSSIGLPNLVIGRRAFPELLQSAVGAATIREAVFAVLRNREAYVATCAETRAVLSAGIARGTTGARVARMIAPWLS